MPDSKKTKEKTHLLSRETPVFDFPEMIHLSTVEQYKKTCMNCENKGFSSQEVNLIQELSLRL